MAKPEAWTEVCLVTLSDGTTDMDIAPIMNSVTFNDGTRDIDFTATLNGGRIGIPKPEEASEIEFEGIPVGTGDEDATSQDGLDVFFHTGISPTGLTKLDAAPFYVDSTLENERKTYTLTILWTNDSTASSGRSAVVSGNYAYRYQYKNCYLTTVQPSFTTDGGLVSKYTFKCAPRNKAAAANVIKQATDGTSSLASL